MLNLRFVVAGIAMRQNRVMRALCFYRGAKKMSNAPMAVMAVVAIIEKKRYEAGLQSGAHPPLYMDVLSEAKV
jgi:hypothetical protein